MMRTLYVRKGAVKVGAILTYNLAKVGGVSAAGYMMLDNLSNSFHNYLHVFWSGGDIVKEQAIAFAQENSGKTLEMTHLGQYLESQPYNPSAWIYASQNFANQVSNGETVRAILYYPGMRPDAVWFEELKVLIEKFVEIIIRSL